MEFEHKIYFFINWMSTNIFANEVVFANICINLLFIFLNTIIYNLSYSLNFFNWFLVFILLFCSNNSNLNNTLIIRNFMWIKRLEHKWIGNFFFRVWNINETNSNSVWVQNSNSRIDIWIVRSEYNSTSIRLKYDLIYNI